MRGFEEIIRDSRHFSKYITSLSEGLSEEGKSDFRELADNTRIKLMENSVTQIRHPYEALSLPLLRVFYPKLIAKELVNVMPIDKPDPVQYFIRGYFGRYVDTGHPYQFPSVDVDISKGPGVPIAAPGEANCNTIHNIFTEIGPGITSDNAHIEKDFNINAVYDGTAWIVCSVIPDVNGNFSQTISLTVGSDVLSGHVDYELGTLATSSVGGNILAVRYEAYASLEENRINPTLRFVMEKLSFKTVDRRISAEWTNTFEQDAKALFDLNLQAQIINMIGEQLALDIDREIINKLLTAVTSSSYSTSHTATFDLNPPGTFVFGRKQWYENIIPTLNTLSAQIYNSSLMGSANTLACNPLDASIFQSLNGFDLVGNSVDGGEVGYRSATVQGGLWKVLVSSVIPKGKVIVKYRSNELLRAAFVYAPYVPALLMPYPLGPIPSLTVMTRYATRVVRPEAIGILNIVDTLNNYPNN
jgi:hypothetical protein